MLGSFRVQGQVYDSIQCEDMSEEQEAAAAADKNFRSSYYKTLGFRESDKSVSHLELLLKAEIYGMRRAVGVYVKSGILGSTKMPGDVNIILL